MVQENSKDFELVGKDYFEWKIDDWNGIANNKEAEYSTKFNVGGFNWYYK